MGAKNARQQILETAARLFFRDGYRAVGVDTIVAESGVAKMTLYRHFPSKDELIAAYLEDTNQKFWSWFENSIASYPGDPAKQLTAFFLALQTLVTTPTCYGCPFLMAATEFPEMNHPGHRISLEHKQGVHARFRAMLAEAGANDGEGIADHLMLLMDGAFLAVRMYGVNNPAANVGAFARQVIERGMI
jgi:AcrR family transcriptional regulator